MLIQQTVSIKLDLHEEYPVLPSDFSFLVNPVMSILDPDHQYIEYKKDVSEEDGFEPFRNVCHLLAWNNSRILVLLGSINSGVMGTRFLTRDLRRERHTPLGEDGWRWI